MSKYMHIYVWRCLSCDITFSTPAVRYAMECPKCGHKDRVWLKEVKPSGAGAKLENGSDL